MGCYHRLMNRMNSQPLTFHGAFSIETIRHGAGWRVVARWLPALAARREVLAHFALFADLGDALALAERVRSAGSIDLRRWHWLREGAEQVGTSPLESRPHPARRGRYEAAL